MAAIGSAALVYVTTTKTLLLLEKGRLALKTAWNNREKVGIALGKARNLIEKKGLLKGIGSAAMGVIKSLSWIPIIGSALGIAAAATVGVLGMKYANKAEKGGFIGGKRHSEGGTIIEAEQGEFIMSRQGVQNVGLGNLYAMNKGGGIIGGKAQDGGEVTSATGAANDMTGFTAAIVDAVSNTKPGVVVASPYGLNEVNYQSRNENFNTKFE